METKKNNRANLEKSRIIFLQTGFIITLALVLLAFQWSDSGVTNKTDNLLIPMYLPDDLPPITKPKEIKTAPPIKIIPEIKIVPDTKNPVNEYKIDNTEPNDSTLYIQRPP